MLDFELKLNKTTNLMCLTTRETTTELTEDNALSLIFALISLQGQMESKYGKINFNQ